jgi:predicted molibdopterin-dependent oxidoreductase YjgC
MPPHEQPQDGELALNTGRTIFHFHTRTKTGRTPQLQAAAPDVWVELSAADARARGLEEGDLAEIRSPRGSIRARVRITALREGVAFVPFHYGWWDRDGAEGSRAANELTITGWDPCSKQPLFKAGRVTVAKVAEAERIDYAPAPTNTASAPLADVPATAGQEQAKADLELVR